MSITSREHRCHIPLVEACIRDTVLWQCHCCCHCLAAGHSEVAPQSGRLLRWHAIMHQAALGGVLHGAWFLSGSEHMMLDCSKRTARDVAYLRRQSMALSLSELCCFMPAHLEMAAGVGLLYRESMLQICCHGHH